MQRFGREIASFVRTFLRMTVLALILAPIFLASFLMLDLPIRNFDQLFDLAVTKPSNWLTIGGLVMALGAPMAILFTRRFGGEEASRAVTAAWGLAAVATLAGLSYLAPALERSDFPSVRFVIAFVSSAMIGQYIAISVYDVIRGGGAWWRAPLIATISGYAAHVLVYYPAAYWTAHLPWFNWMISDFTVKCVIAILFLPIYRFLQKTLRPMGGYGGR